MRIKVYGAKAPWCQAPRIIEGLIGIGHVPVSDNYDFIYCNNPPYDQGDEEHKDPPLNDEKAFKIFNVLDIPNVLDFDLEKLKSQLKQANLVTCISKFTQKQLKEIGFDSKVIWNPIKDIFADSRAVNRPYDFLYVGRANDPNKRYNLLKKVNDKISEISVVGNEIPNFGRFHGFVSDYELNGLYNLHQFVLLPSKIEGLGLPMLEAMAAGSIPIVCSDNYNSCLVPSFCVAEPNEDAIFDKIQMIKNDYDRYRNIVLEQYTYKIQKKFSKFGIARNIINAYREQKGIK